MEIFNMIRGHFALLIDKPFYTPAKGKKFTIESINTKEGDWQLVLKISTGKQAKVYISDILRVYTHLVSANHFLTQTEIENQWNSKPDMNWTGRLITQGSISYILPLISTFSDIEVTTDPYRIRFIPLRES